MIQIYPTIQEISQTDIKLLIYYALPIIIAVIRLTAGHFFLFYSSIRYENTHACSYLVRVHNQTSKAMSRSLMAYRVRGLMRWTMEIISNIFYLLLSITLKCWHSQRPSDLIRGNLTLPVTCEWLLILGVRG